MEAAPTNPDDIPHDLSPALLPLYRFELSQGNVVVRVDRKMWTRCPLAVLFRDPLNFDAARAALQVDPTVSAWDSRDTHYDLEAGWLCEQTRQTLSGPLPKRDD